jgi:multisubunit Na+/H+ antiporter MnhC subunit
MSAQLMAIFWPSVIFIAILAAIGLYCILLTYNLIRALIGLELLVKSVTLAMVLAGYVSGRMALAQAMVVTFIVIEVVVMTVAVGVVLGIRRHNDSLDTRKIRNLKG